jgi:hypothetical protein
MRCSIALICSLSAALTACGGGGGGGSSATLAPFVKFSSIAVPGAVRIGGSTQEVSFTTDSNEKSTLDGPISDYKSGAFLDATFAPSVGLTRLALTSAEGAKLTFDKSNGDTLEIGPYGAVGLSENQQNAVIAIVGDGTRGWEYQAFGVWSTGAGTGRGTASVGTFGAVTASGNVPVTGTGNFTGLSLGLYLDSAGTSSAIGSDMTATADFGNSSIAFTTTNSVDIVSGADRSELDLSGSLLHGYGAPDYQKFRGVVTSVGGGASNATMSGNATGNYYGPSAIEIGGTYAVSGGGASYQGAFGGKR